MILDSALQFDPAGTAVTTTADSTNIIDLGTDRDIGIGHDEIQVLVLCDTTFASATASATLNVQLKGAPDNGSGGQGGYYLIGESGALPLGALTAGNKIAQFDVPPVADSFIPVATPLLTTTASSTSATVSSATGIVQGLFVNSAGVVPGTTVASISGTTVTLSQAAASSTTAVSSAFMATAEAQQTVPRFLKLTYTVSNTMTAGKLEAYLAPECIDNVVAYKPGVVVAN